MIVEIIRSNGRDTFPKVGEVYYAERYWLDPMDKVTLHYLVDPVTHKKLEKQHGDSPLCNEYIENVDIITKNGRVKGRR